MRTTPRGWLLEREDHPWWQVDDTAPEGHKLHVDVWRHVVVPVLLHTILGCQALEGNLGR